MKLVTIAIGLGSLLLSGCESIVGGHNPDAAPVPAAATASPSPVGKGAPAAGRSTTVPPVAATKPSIRGGQDSYSARKVAQASQCNEMPAPVLVAKSPGIELYEVTCKSGDLLAVQCDFGTCRALK